MKARMPLIALLILLAVTPETRGSPSDTVFTGQTCVPTDSTIQNDLFNTTLNGDAWVGWQPTKTGTIILHCPIPLTTDGHSHLEVYYRNNTSCTNCANDRILVKLIKTSMTDFTDTLVTSINTVTGVNDGAYRALVSTFSDTHDDGNFFYFLRIEMRRDSTNNNTQRFYAAVVY